MARAHATPRQSSPAGILLFVILALAALYFARDVFMPLALAVLLSFLLAPSVTRLQRWGMGRVLAVVLTVVLAFASIGAIGWVLTAQVIDLAKQLPEYKDNIRAKFEPLRAGAGGIFARAKETLREIQEELEEPEDEEEGDEEQIDAETAAPAAPAAQRPPPRPPPPSPPQPRPVQVEVIEPSANPLLFIRSTLGPLLRPVVTAGIVVVFVIFFLFKREDLRARVLRLLGPRQLYASTEALDDAARRVSRYLLMMCLINGSVGLALGIGLAIIGVPNAVLWGFLSATLRFIPYVGAWIAGVMPVLVAMAASPGWTEPILVASLIVVLELVSNNIMEPWLYGTGTGISVVAVLLGAVFWTWLWGPVGLLLATPLTVCLVVIGRHVPNLEFLSVLLGDEPALTPGEQLYQRLLARDEVEVMEIAEEAMREHSVAHFFENVLVPVLSLAERDRHRGRLPEERLDVMYRSIRVLIEDSETPAEADAPENHAPPIVCLPARDEADELVAMMFAKLAEARGISAIVVSADALAGERLATAEEHRGAAVLISALPPHEVLHARSLCTRLRQRLPDVRIVVGLWRTGFDPQRARDRLKVSCSDAVVTELEAAVEHAAALATRGAGLGTAATADSGAEPPASAAANEEADVPSSDVA